MTYTPQAFENILVFMLLYNKIYNYLKDIYIVDMNNEKSATYMSVDVVGGHIVIVLTTLGYPVKFFVMEILYLLLFQL